MQESLSLARKFLAAAQDRQTAMANRRRRAVNYEPGDLVLIRTKFPPAPTSSRIIKLPPRKIGPFEVKQAHANYVELQLPPSLDFHPWINVEFVDKYVAPPNSRPQVQLPPRIVSDSDGETHEEYLVKGMLGHRARVDKRGRPYLYPSDNSQAYEYWVEWQRYSIADDWEPLSSFADNSRATIASYHRHQKLGPPRWDEKAIRGSRP